MRSLPPPVLCSCCSKIIMEGKAPRPGHVVLCRTCLDRLTSRFSHCDQCFGTIDQHKALSHFVVGYGIMCDACYISTHHQPSDDDELS